VHVSIPVFFIAVNELSRILSIVFFDAMNAPALRGSYPRERSKSAAIYGGGSLDLRRIHYAKSSKNRHASSWQ